MDDTKETYHAWKKGLAKRGKTPMDMLLFAREHYGDDAYCDRIEALIRENGDPVPTASQDDIYQ